MKYRLLWLGLLPVFLLVACSGAAAPAVAPATAVPTPTVPPPTATATAPAVLEFPLGGGASADNAGEEQAPGRYKTPDWFSLPFTFETTSVFRGMGQRLPEGELFGLAQGQRLLPPKQLLFWTLSPGVSPEEAVSELRATPQLEFSLNQTVTVAGVSGTQFETTAQQEVTIPALATLVGRSGAWYTNSAQVQLRFIVLEVAGRTLVTYIEAPPGEFQDFAAAADQVLSTVEFDVEAASLTELPTASATTTPAAEPVSEPVEFVWSMTGELNPLDGPADLAVDSQGHLYVVDAGNNRIQVFDSEGHFLSMWGAPGEGGGEFNFLRANGDLIGAIAIDAEDNIFVADNANQRIQKFDSNGEFLLQWGTPGHGEGQFLSPVGIAVDRQGNVYVSDDSREDIQKFDNDGRFLLQWGGHGSGDGQFNYMGGLDIDGEGNVYVADFSNHRVQKFDSEGNFLAKWGTHGQEPGQFNEPGGIAVDGEGNVFVVEFAAHPPENYRVQVFDSSGNFLMQWGSPGRADGQFIHPLSIAIDAEGNVYVSDETNRVQKFQATTSTAVSPTDPETVIRAYYDAQVTVINSLIPSTAALASP